MTLRRPLRHALAVLPACALLAACSDDDDHEISEDEARAVLEGKYFLVEKTAVERNREDGLWYDAESGELADGVAWCPDSGLNIDDYLNNPEDRPTDKEARPDLIGYVRYFEEGRQQGPTIEFTRAGNPNVIFYYADNSQQWRWRFDNKASFTLKESIQLTDGYAEGICQRWHPNGRLRLDAQFVLHDDLGHNFAGRAREWAPDGTLLMDVDFDHNGAGIETIRSMADGFRVYRQGQGDLLEVMLAGVMGGNPVAPGSQAEAWLLERAEVMDLPAEEIEQPDESQPFEEPSFVPLFGPEPGQPVPYNPASLPTAG